MTLSIFQRLAGNLLQQATCNSSRPYLHDGQNLLVWPFLKFAQPKFNILCLGHRVTLSVDCGQPPFEIVIDSLVPQCINQTRYIPPEPENCAADKNVCQYHQPVG